MEFEEFAAARLPALLRYAAVLTGDRELAGDLVQEVLARALVRWRRISGLDRPEAYLRTMVTNEYLSQRRRRRLPTRPLAHADAETAAGGDPFARLGTRDELWRQLAELPPRQRAVLVLRYYEDLTDAEISQVLGCREGTVRGYASRALATLRTELDAATHATNGEQR